jgi:hypothetical protein
MHHAIFSNRSLSLAFAGFVPIPDSRFPTPVQKP